MRISPVARKILGLLIILFYVNLILAFSIEGKFTISGNESSSGESDDEGNGETTLEEGVETEELECISVWSCEEWGDCHSFSKSRFCVDLNGCVEDRYEFGFCSEEIFNTRDPTTNLPNWVLLTVSFILLLIALVIVIFAIRKEMRKTKKHHRRIKKKKRR